ncbi:hypothetical protein KUTeg_001193 [Tegillarca granosa]|uniref:VWFD domain-containing protein n=1 Tax=Tegillarca granosa TaxID=220873 RepID=A0ABQ9FYR7_TEGGR|nr:hypothetical protein KUTeg_001193 [Tegillarca granosa]
MQENSVVLGYFIPGELVQSYKNSGVEKRYLTNCKVVNGNWSPWSSWSNCVTDFATYSRSRYRTCTNPAPQGGQFCYGSSKEVEACNRTCICTGLGDPHYTTFDKQQITFNGPCKYILAETRDPFGQCSFRVEVKHEMFGKAAYADYVDVYVYGGQKIRMTHDMKLYCGLVVEIDKTRAVKIKFPKRGAVYGICGDCNGKKDDYKTKNGHDVSHSPNKYNLIGNSYQSNVHSCKPNNSTDSFCNPLKNPALLASIGTTSICSQLNPVNKKSIFLACNVVNAVKALAMFMMCVFDFCMLAQQPSQQHTGACHIINNYAADCYKMKLVSPTAVGAICPPKCQSNSLFNPSMTGCPNSCANPSASKNCSLPNVPGCACNPGFMLDSGSKCVLPSQCGCKIPNGNYYPVGTSVVINNCRTKYVCSGTPPVFHKYNQTPCGQYAVCQTVNGVDQCVCPPGLSGNPHTGCYSRVF